MPLTFASGIVIAILLPHTTLRGRHLLVCHALSSFRVFICSHVFVFATYCVLRSVRQKLTGSRGKGVQAHVACGQLTPKYLFPRQQLDLLVCEHLALVPGLLSELCPYVIHRGSCCADSGTVTSISISINISAGNSIGINIDMSCLGS